MHVLIIDDDSEDTEIFCAALGEVLPDAVCTVSNSCLNVVALINFLPLQNFVFIDGHMAPVSGKKCLIELFKAINTFQTKVIIHTGSLSPRETTEFINLGVSEIIRKAYGFEELKANLKRILK